jgi:hypothetical protein
VGFFFWLVIPIIGSTCGGLNLAWVVPVVGRNLQMFDINQSVCPWQAFPT